MPSMTRSPLTLVQETYGLAKEHLPSYSSQFSRKDFTQAQMFTVLVLRQFFKTAYRGIQQILLDWSELREALDLQKVPHWTALEKAEKRLLKKGSLTESLALRLHLPESAA